MARKKQQVASGFVLFDVIYEDGTQTSNRKVPATDLGGLDGDAPARTFIESAGPQDRRDVRRLARAHQVDRPLAQACGGLTGFSAKAPRPRPGRQSTGLAARRLRSRYSRRSPGWNSPPAD